MNEESQPAPPLVGAIISRSQYLRSRGTSIRSSFPCSGAVCGEATIRHVEDAAAALCMLPFQVLWSAHRALLTHATTWFVFEAMPIEAVVLWSAPRTRYFEPERFGALMTVALCRGSALKPARDPAWLPP